MKRKGCKITSVLIYIVLSANINVLFLPTYIIVYVPLNAMKL